MDTSVIISLADPSDVFHDQSVIFVDTLAKHRVECNTSSPLVVELGKLVEAKGTKRCLAVIHSMEESGIYLKNTDIKQVWKISQAYLEGGVLTKRHRLDLLHYAAASLLACTHLASWNSKQFNYKVAMKVSKVNAKQGLSNLIAGKPDYIMRQENLG